MTNRPGLMIRGKVVMAPGLIDSVQAQMFLPKTRVYIDGRWRSNVVGYDEQGREAVVWEGGKLQHIFNAKVEAYPHR